MDSTKKGDAFEARVYKIIQDLLYSEALPIAAKHSRLFKKKRYFSKDRGKDIIVDLAIETTRPGATNPSLYTLIECKDYGKSIPVDDVEEFHSKIRQLTGANVKGFMFVTSHLQEAALNYAFSNGIGVARVKGESDLEWVLERRLPTFSTSKRNANFINVVNALSNEFYYDQGDELLGFDELTPVTSFEALLSIWLKDLK